MAADLRAARAVAARPGGLAMQASEFVSAYLPLLLMGLLALGTWWLVKNTPVPEPPAAPRALRHVPDYTMQTFRVQRFDREGRLHAEIEGDELRHYPDTDTIEVDNPRIHSYARNAQRTVATARRALSNADGSEVQLLGGARVVRDGPGDDRTEFQGEFLHAFFATEELRSHLPVVVRRGGVEVRANSLAYRHQDQRVQLSGRVRAIFPPAGGAPRTEAP